MNRACLILMACVVASALSATAADVSSQREIMALIVRDNPRLKAAQAKWEAMKKRIPQARAWEDPMVGVDVERHGTTRFDTFSDNEWMISQAVPVSGKNLARGRAAVAEAISAFEEVRRIELDIVSRAKTALARLAGAYGQLEINKRNQALLEQFTEISRAKYESGTQSQADVLIAQTDLARLGETRSLLERDVSDQQTQLNVLMNRPAASSLGHPSNLDFTPVSWSRQKIEAYALLNRPEIAMAQRKVEAEKARVQLAQRQWIPDPRLRVEAREFRESGGIQEYDTGVFFDVPLVNYRKYSAAVAEANKSLEAGQHEYEAVQTEVLGLVRDQLKKIETAAHNYELFRGNIAPLARQAVEATRSSYESDKTSFLELVTTRRTFQDADSAQLQHLIEHEVAVAELDAIIGRITPRYQEGHSK
ncbi:MAG: TolC family protein [Verrucomicrobiota bacterium]